MDIEIIEVVRNDFEYLLGLTVSQIETARDSFIKEKQPSSIETEIITNLCGFVIAMKGL